MSTAAVAMKAKASGERVSASEPVHGKIVDFLMDEAYLLDDNKHHEWLACVADDIQYKSNRVKTLYRKQGSGVVPGGEFNDNLDSLKLRVRRNLDTASAFDRDPLPRFARMITNVVVHTTEAPDEYAVRSKITLYRNRFDDTTYDMMTATRNDVIRFTKSGPKLAARVITPDIQRPGALFSNVLL